MKRKIYLASSWRNENQTIVVEQLRTAGHEVYDFKNPRPDDKGFGWTGIDPNWRTWTPEQFKHALQHPLAVKGHRYDHEAMEWADAGVLLLPCGSSAHLEAGWLAGRNKRTCVYAPTTLREPELMYRSLALTIGDDVFFTHIDEVLAFLERDLCAQCCFNGRRTPLAAGEACPVATCSSHRSHPVGGV